MKKHPKLDPNLVAISQKYELDYIVGKFKKEGTKITSANIRVAVKSVGRSRRKVYGWLRSKFCRL